MANNVDLYETLVHEAEMSVMKEEGFGGTCPVCNLRYDGAEHICPGRLSYTRNPNTYLQAPYRLTDCQHTDPVECSEHRHYGDRLQEGFNMLQYRGWNIED